MVRPVVGGMDGRGGRMLARKSGRGLPHDKTLRADGCLPECQGPRTFGALVGSQKYDGSNSHLRFWGGGAPRQVPWQRDDRPRHPRAVGATCLQHRTAQNPKAP